VGETVGKVSIELDDALAWARCERRIQVRLPDGTFCDMAVMQYRRTSEMHERRRAHRGKPASQAAPGGSQRLADAGSRTLS
jgi:hypothetical protein